MSTLHDLTIAEARTPLRFAAVVSRPYLVPAILASLASIAASILDTTGPFIFKKIVDAITIGGTGHSSEVWMWVATYVIFFLFFPLLLWRASGFIGMLWTVGMRASSTYALTSYVTKHSTDFFHKRFAGAIGGKVGNTSQGVKNLSEKFLWSYLNMFVTLLATITLAFYTQALIGWLFIAWLLLGLPLNFFFARRRIPLGAAVQREDTRLRGRIIDMLTNVGAMHEFARRGFEMTSLSKVIEDRYRAGLKNWRSGEFARIYNNVLQLAFVGGIMFVTVYTWSRGLITAGDIILILSLIGGLGYRMEELGREINDFAETYGEIQEGLEDLINPHDIEDKPGAKLLAPKEADVSFKKATFIYNEGSAEVVSDFSLEIPAGQKVGLIGRSGAGKSTLVRLLLRHYELSGGSIEIGGANIAEVTQESLRETIGVVPQEPLLFHRTIRENIAYGKLDATDDEIIEAAKLAQAHDFIERLSQKYDTMVGERGVKLSGGERQRIALARAILKPSKVLLLDEATSALDSESELAIQKALHILMEGKTVIAIAHRLSTLREMDRLIILDKGKIIEDGSHDELIKKGGLYAELWAHQSGGYINDEE